MLIKSQDCKVIVNTNTLVSLNVFNGKIFCDTTHDPETYGYTMGTYASDDEAQAALDKLYKAIDEPKYDMGNEEFSSPKIKAKYPKKKVSYW